MGLDVVELVMEVEEHFGIELRTKEAQKVRTIGDLVDVVYAFKLVEPSSSDSPMEKSQILAELLPIVSEQLGIDVSTLRPESRFVEDLGAN